MFPKCCMVLNCCKFLVICLLFVQTPWAQEQNDLDGFFRAVTDGRDELVASLVQEHPEWVNRELFLGIRPLYRAAVLGRSQVAQILIENGADLQATTDRGSMPLHAAAQNGHLAVVEMLLAARVSADPVDESGVTPLHLAARSKHDNVMRELLRNGADPNRVDKSGRTPLHHAAGLGRLSSVQVLVAAGAELNPLDRAGYSPLGRARVSQRNDFAEVGAWLEAQGGEDIRPEPKDKK